MRTWTIFTPNWIRLSITLSRIIRTFLKVVTADFPTPETLKGVTRASDIFIHWVGCKTMRQAHSGYLWSAHAFYINRQIVRRADVAAATDLRGLDCLFGPVKLGERPGSVCVVSRWAIIGRAQRRVVSHLQWPTEVTAIYKSFYLFPFGMKIGS